MRVFDLKDLKRVTLVVALFFGANIFAKAQKYQQLIAEAYSLSVEKKRAEALNVLTQYLKNEGIKSPASKEVLQAIDQVAAVFYGEKTQQQYELILSTQLVSPADSINKLKELLRAEPYNSEITEAIAKLYIYAGDCGGALESLKDLKEKIGFYSEPLEILESEAFVCAGQYENYVKNKMIAVQLMTQQNAIYWNLIDFEYQFKNSALSKAKDDLQLAFKADSKYPEIYYWQWKMEPEAAKTALIPAKAYSSLCKKLSQRDRQRYNLDLRMCSRQVEVENFLKKQNGAENQ